VSALWRRLATLSPQVVDGIVAVELSTAAVAQLAFVGPLPIVRFLPVIGTCVPLIWRRRFPIACYLAQFACALLTLRTPMLASIVALFVGIYSCGVYSRRRWLSLVVPVASAGLLEIAFPSATPEVPSALVLLLVGVALWLAGNTIRERQERLSALQERALRLERERELAAVVAAADERARIARELHDVVAHSVSVMVVQGGAARTLLTRQPERAAAALRSVEASGREALDELRRMLGLLTDQASRPTLDPQPGLGQLDALVGRVGEAGQPVALRVEGTPRALPPGLDLTAYRILQEALTNALKHARGARTDVLVGFDEHELRLEVLDAGTASGAVANGTGRGLAGMRERVAVFGGSLETGDRPEGGFAVRARLPLRPA
jgi:signal transduction histidine kinase